MSYQNSKILLDKLWFQIVAKLSTNKKGLYIIKSDSVKGDTSIATKSIHNYFL